LRGRLPHITLFILWLLQPLFQMLLSNPAFAPSTTCLRHNQPV
jgi:hypothetical protein